MSSPLAPALEYSIFNALLNKEISVADVDRKTLSQVGQNIHKAISKLEEDKIEWDLQGVVLLATEGFGLDKARLQEYLANVEKHKTPAAVSIHSLLRDRTTLLSIANEITQQVTSGEIDLAKIQALTIARQNVQIDLSTVTEDLKNGAPEGPTGPPLRSLPKLSSCTNGVYGIWLVAGVPAVGKSTLAVQVSVDVSRSMPVLYYDFENTRSVILHHLVENFGLAGARRIGARLYIRDSLRTLAKDLQRVPPPACIVVDSIQKVPTGSDDRLAGLNSWIRRFEEIKKQGYHVMLVSEINRASYTGVPRLDAFKDSGELEYVCDSGMVLTERDNGLVGVWIVKNRHYPVKGMVTLLERDPQRSFWFKEVDLGVNI